MAKPKKSKSETADEIAKRQERFCQEYIKDLNGTKAAERAGYSEKNATEQASRLLTKANVKAHVQKLLDQRSERTAITADLVLQELLKVAKSDLRKLFDDSGKLLSVDEWPDDVALAVSSVEVEELFDGHGKDKTHIGYTKKLRLWDKIRSLELLGKHLKLFTDRVDITGRITLADLVTESLKKDGEK